MQRHPAGASNNTLAAIGIHHPKLRKRAIAIGEKIGLYRDWPVSKGCTPPYVTVWVDFMAKRQGDDLAIRQAIVEAVLGMGPEPLD
jgi:hypothetical protein